MTELVLDSVDRQRSRIVVEAGATVKLADLLEPRDGRTSVAILTQPPVTRLAAEVADGLAAVGLEPVVRELPDGEAAKQLGVVEDVLAWLSGRGLTRDDTIVAVGGGALTDLAGFVAAVYLRGVECVYLPTTLLGAVDASIGGKTAVNVGGKNLAGAFRHPALVVVDTDLLERLPETLRREGAAEAIKAGLVGDPDLVELYERHGLAAPLDDVVLRAVAVKHRIVAEDFTEQGERAVLNYGHTVGHAVEVALGLPHGEAISLGMAAAGAVAERLTGFTEAPRQRALLERVGLPIVALGGDAEGVGRLMELDKKRTAGGLRMVLLERIGRPVVSPVDDATVAHALASIGIR